MMNHELRSPAECATFIRSQIPPGGLFGGMEWRTAPQPFLIEPTLFQEFEKLGRILLQFYRAVNLLYRHSIEGKQPDWIARWLDQGKPESLIALQRHPTFKSAVPRVIRPDILLTDDGFKITELDSVPGGIGLTTWMYRTYADALSNTSGVQHLNAGYEQMLGGFKSIFGSASRVHIVVSEESAGYRPEMEWMATACDAARFFVRDTQFTAFDENDAVYRFFELFDLCNIGNAQTLFEMASEKRLRVTPPPRPIFEEKMLFALLWNRNLRNFWRQELGESFFHKLQAVVPYTWLVDPSPLPPHASLPEINLTDWRQLKTLSQRERELVLKVSGFSAESWGARGVYIGSDLSTPEWAEAVDKALSSFPQSPYVLQRFHKPRLVNADYYDFQNQTSVSMQGRARLCPYYFVAGEGDSARAVMGGTLATICPADKKIIHGMTDAIMVPCIPKT